MTPLEQLQAQLIDWQTPVVAAALVQAKKDVLITSINTPGVDVYTKANCISTLAALDAEEAEYIASRIASLQDRIAEFEDQLVEEVI